VASRLLNALVAGLGVGALAWAVRREWRWAVHGPLFAVYLLFTAQAIVCLPEHFGLSSGLLSVSYAVFRSRGDWRRRAAAQAGLAVLAGGVTVTNAAVPAVGLLLAVAEGLRPRLTLAAVRRLVIAGVLLGMAAGGVVVGRWYTRYQKLPAHKYYVFNYFHVGALAEPQALLHTAYGVVYPAVGPTPTVNDATASVTYEPYVPWPFDPLQGAAAAAWVALLAAGVVRTLRRREERATAVLLLTWVAGNLLLHVVWGDEYFLYSPHWAWALFALVLAGSRDMPWYRVVPLAAVAAVGQVHTLLTIHEQLARVAFLAKPLAA
jgi:hypothetical protein